jgi:1-deoxyxylulose-5-phosphate synthase
MAHTLDYHGMPHRRMGNSGLWVSEVGLGLWKWGDPSYDGSRVGDEEGGRILDRALELGATHWDTANSYNQGFGNSERLLGRYLNRRGSRVRGQIVLATKVRNPVRDEHEMTREFTPNERGGSRLYILRAVEDSLRRLQTDTIDVLYHHAPVLLPDGSQETPLEEMWDAFHTLVAQGKVRYLAVSNRSLEQLAADRETLKAVSANPSRRIIGVQNWYNLLQRPKVAALDNAGFQDEQAYLDYLAQAGIGLIPYVPLAVGLLTGRYRKGAFDTSGRLYQEDWRDDFLTERNLALVEDLAAFAGDKGCTLSQLAIAWLLSRDVVCSVIAGVTKMAHLEDNVQAVSLKLTREELAWLDRLTGPETPDFDQGEASADRDCAG